MNSVRHPVLPVPNQPAERFDVLDALRGFALIGIITIHASTHFLATMVPPSVKTLNVFSPIDTLLGKGIIWLAFGKLFTIFSFLFGLSFALQLERAERRAGERQPFVGLMLRRFAVLFGLGLLHNLFYTGDVLCLYAILGVLLGSLRQISDKVLLVVALVFQLNVPLFISRIYTVIFPPTSAQIASSKAWLALYAQHAEVVFRTYQHGTLAEVMKLNAETGLASNLFGQLYTGRLFMTFGLFLLGLWAGRQRLFVNTPHHQVMLRRLLGWNGVLAVLSTAVWIDLTGGTISWPALPGWLDVLAHTAFNLQQATLSACYILAFTLLFWQRRTWLQAQLVAVGRMGLTTYLGRVRLRGTGI